MENLHTDETTVLSSLLCHREIVIYARSFNLATLQQEFGSSRTFQNQTAAYDIIYFFS